MSLASSFSFAEDSIGASCIMLSNQIVAIMPFFHLLAYLMARRK